MRPDTYDLDVPEGANGTGEVLNVEDLSELTLFVGGTFVADFHVEAAATGVAADDPDNWIRLTAMSPLTKGCWPLEGAFNSSRAVLGQLRIVIVNWVSGQAIAKLMGRNTRSE